MPYEDLVKRLRDQAVCADSGNEIGNSMYLNILKAADAIEELQHSLEIMGDANAKLRDQVPEWISVTERLPENCADVLAYIERNAWGDGDVPYRKREMAIGYHVNGLWHVDGCSGVDCIAWMPLPESPKEETR